MNILNTYWLLEDAVKAMPVGTDIKTEVAGVTICVTKDSNETKFQTKDICVTKDSNETKFQTKGPVDISLQTGEDGFSASAGVEDVTLVSGGIHGGFHGFSANISLGPVYSTGFFPVLTYQSPRKIIRNHVDRHDVLKQMEKNHMKRLIDVVVSTILDEMLEGFSNPGLLHFMGQLQAYQSWVDTLRDVAHETRNNPTSHIYLKFGVGFTVGDGFTAEIGMNVAVDVGGGKTQKFVMFQNGGRSAIAGASGGFGYTPRGHKTWDGHTHGIYLNGQFTVGDVSVSAGIIITSSRPSIVNAEDKHMHIKNFLASHNYSPTPLTVAPGSHGHVMLGVKYRVMVHNLGTEKYLDADAASDLLHCTTYENKNTTWCLVDAGGGAVRFCNEYHHGEHMDADGGSDRVYRSNYKNDNTSWYLESLGDASFRIKSKVHNAKESAYLDCSDGGKVYRSKYKNEHTRWRFVPVLRSL